MGPVIECIDRGHMFRHDQSDVQVKGRKPTLKRCKLDGQLWPCDAMKHAMAEQSGYGEILKAEAIALAKLSTEFKPTGLFQIR